MLAKHATSTNTYALNKHLVLLVLVVLDRDAIGHLDPTHTLLSQEVTDLDALAVTSKDKVDREMGIDGTHLVLETERNTLDHVSHGSLGRTEASEVLAASVPDHKLQLRATGALHKTEIHGHMTEVLCIVRPWRTNVPSGAHRGGP